ncbi:Lrp/AsnC family transcriptional regulator [Streptomyces sp. NPDC004539]|uniref:Lrp/AsnC family transcriptional regulator n=1 Tax=Streptomyces sp. NPDC004539 TaxID=3154280 RepID=UPI0033B26A3C
MHSLDALDARILLARDDSPEAPLIEIASRLGVSRNTVHARLKRLRDSGALGTPSASLSPGAIGRPLLAFMTLSVAQQQIDSVYAAISATPEVIEVHTTTGDADLMLRVVARDTADLHRITQSVQSAPGVQRSNTSIATTEVVPHRMSPLLNRLAADGS